MNGDGVSGKGAMVGFEEGSGLEFFIGIFPFPLDGGAEGVDGQECHLARSVIALENWVDD
jgi:hypothetical protein